MTYFHGGYGGLRRGDLLLPPKQTGAPSNADFGADICRRDRVYITTDFNAALLWAAMHPSNEGRVYEVKPIGEVSEDPDCNQKGLSFEAKMAKIVRTMHVSREQLMRVRQLAMVSL